MRAVVVFNTTSANSAACESGYRTKGEAFFMDQGSSGTEEDVYARHFSDNDSQKTQDDPLSEIWDAEDADENESVVTPPLDTMHECNAMQVKTVSGVYKVDLTPPEIQLRNLETSVRYFYKKRMADECLKDAVRQLTLTRIVEGDEKQWKLASCHAMIAKVYWNLKSYADQTLEHTTEAQRLLSLPNRSSEKPEEFEILDTALLASYLRGKALLALKRYDDAAKELQEAEKLLEKRGRLGDMKEKNFWLTEISTAMARIRARQNDTTDALRYLRRVQDLMEKRYGSETPRLIPLYQEIARLEESAGKMETAIELYMKAHSIAKSSFDEKNPLVGDAALTLARAYARSKEKDANAYIEPYFNESIASYVASLGPTDAKTLTAQQELANEMSASGRQSEAISLLTQCLKSLSDVGEEYEMKAAKVYRQLADLCAGTGRNRQAAQFLKNCLHIESMHYGPTSKKTKATKEELAALVKNTNNGAGRGQSLERRSRFSAEAATDAERRFSWHN